MQPYATTQLYARIAGAAYLAIFVLAIWANFTVFMNILAPGDPQATLSNLLEREGAFRRATAAMFIVMIADLLVAWALFQVFSPVQRSLAIAATLFRIAYTISHIPVLLCLVSALRIATSNSFGPALQAALIEDQLIAHEQGFQMTLIFFGVHLGLLGLMIFKTRYAPLLIGGLLVLAGVGYFLDGVLSIGAPGLRNTIPNFEMLIVILPSLIGEGLLALWLLIKGVRAPDMPTVA